MADTALFKHVNVAGLTELQNNPDTLVFDIRDANSYALSHIPGAINLNNDNLQTVLGNADKSAPVVVCCYHGISSQPAAEFVASQGFTDVYSLDGGFEGWKQSQP